MRGLDCNGWLRIWWWFRRSASAAQFRARWYHCCHFILLSCCLSFFLVFSCFLSFASNLFVVYSNLVIFGPFLVCRVWVGGSAQNLLPCNCWVSFCHVSVIWCHLFFMCLQFVCHVCAIFCRFMPLLLLGLVGFRIIGNQIKRQKSHDEWQRPNEKEMTKTWHLFDNPQSVLARCSQQIVGQSHVYKWCQHQPTVCTHAAWQNQLPEYDKKHITKQTFRIDFPVFAGLSVSLAESNSLGILRIKLNQRT